MKIIAPTSRSIGPCEPVVRGKGGRWVSRLCPDPNCGGYLQNEGDGWLRCDGLTHDTNEGELRECTRWVEA